MAAAPAPWLASTKLTAPARRRDVLRRQRLIEALSHSLTYSRLTLVSAPAGAGKTTLLSELPAAFPELRFCWLLLDLEDNDPSRFTTALLASLQFSGVLAADDAPLPNEPRLLVTFLINHVSQSPADRFALVIDDLHVISEPAVHGVLDYLIGNAPANLHLVLATRHDPPMSLSRRRARGEVGEIRLDDLSFSEQEAGELASRCLGLSLTAEEVRQLHLRTEGWAAGIRLLATSLSQSPAGRATLLQGGTQGSRQIFDFLADEVLDRQPPELRRFLLETSILSRLTPEVCDSITGRDDSLAVLEDLYRRNLYVVAADETQSSFRYHDLFADFLRERLKRERPRDLAGLHAKAAAAESNPSDRMRHLIAARNWDQAAQEIERVGAEYAMRGFVATLRRWIGELPEPVLEGHPRLQYLLAQAVWTLSDFGQARPYVERALDAFRKTNDHAGQAEATIALANSALMMNDLDKCRDLLREALTFDLPDAGRIQLLTVSALEALYRRDLAEALPHFDQVISMVESGEGRTNPLALMIVLFSGGFPGRIPKVSAVCRKMRLELGSEPDFSHAIYHILNSACLAKSGDIAEGRAEAERCMSAAQACGQVSMAQAAVCINFIVTATSRGDWDEVEHWVAVGGDESRHGLIIRAWKLHFLYFQARARWHSGNLEGLKETYAAAMAPNPVEAPPAVAYRLLIRGMMRMAERAYAQAEQAFREALAEEESFGFSRSTSSARVMLAYVLLVRGRPQEAMEVFAPHLKWTCSDNLAGQLMFDNPIIQPLLRQAHQANMERAFCERVLSMLGSPLNAMEAVGGEELSDREMEVLRVMAEGLGNREIAERLFVSEATVKTHVQRILRKLDATTRTQAVARARELMLI